MKIIIRSTSIVCSGKAWEIRETLKQYNKQFTYVTDWIASASKPTNAQTSKLENVQNFRYNEPTSRKEEFH
ncbi:Z-ring formation inhibitor MciZ [Aureibacillus halotolerans]|uniref:Uncharacterized protein DUF3936 n=1 Tax=Aureibacillus halotolerans TaxID=1508390 RepID=A0A4R6U9F6_9BACI|nr:uncharacterized protein DUF3936 [Aureibacillus halotolerans]